MNPHLMPHLTPDRLADCLIDPASLDSNGQQHLAACPECRMELNAFQADLAAFNLATLAWAESRSVTLPRGTVSIVRGTRLPLAWSAIAFACAAIAMATLHHTPATVQEGSIHTHRSSQIASDNQLLANIDEAVEAPVVSPTHLFEVPKTYLGTR